MIVPSTRARVKSTVRVAGAAGAAEARPVVRVVVGAGYVTGKIEI